MVYRSGLENRQVSQPREFESHPFRQKFVVCILGVTGVRIGHPILHTEPYVACDLGGTLYFLRNSPCIEVDVVLLYKG